MFGFHFLENIEENTYFKYKGNIYRRIQKPYREKTILMDKIQVIKLRSIKDGDLVLLAPNTIVKKLERIKALDKLQGKRKKLKQKVGDNSIGIQAGGDINIESKSEKKHE